MTVDKDYNSKGANGKLLEQYFKETKETAENLVRLYGNEKQKQEALKVKYLFITGDTIDGVGVYPSQEKDILIKDVNEQYKKLAEFLVKIRKKFCGTKFRFSHMPGNYYFSSGFL